MSTKEQKPETSAHFIRDKRLLDEADVAKYNSRLKELDLPRGYVVYNYEPASNGKNASYWVCKQGAAKCPECGTPYKADAIASVTESKLTHYCRVAIPREGKKPTYEIRPATIYLRRIRWRCYSCYSNIGTYNARMQDDSKLVDGNEKLTRQLKTLLGQQAMRMEVNALAEIFDISPHTVKKCFDKTLKQYDAQRDWDNISALGLYTVVLNVQGQSTNFCLCTDADSESLIELFPYEDTKAVDAFLRSLKNKQNIQRVFTSIDGAAYNFAKTNFGSAMIMVDRVDVRKRLLKGLETVKEGNENSPDFPILRRHWKLLDNVEKKIPADSKDYDFLTDVLSAFPRVGVAYWLKETGMEIYRCPMNQRQRVVDWIFSDKHKILAYEQLEQCMIQAREPVVQFAEQYNGVDRKNYEKAILAVEQPLTRYVSLSDVNKSALWSRAASLQMIRAHTLYGAAMMANHFAAQESNKELHNESLVYNAMNHCMFDMSGGSLSKSAFRSNTAVETGAPPEIYLHDFKIPLSIYPILLLNGLAEYGSSLLYLQPLRKNNEVKKMPRKAKAVVDDTSKMRDVETYTHDDKKRTNNPPVGMAQHDRGEEKVKTYQYDPHLDPTLQWAGKEEEMSFEVPTSSIHIHESIKPLNIIARVTKGYSKAIEGQLEGQLSMFADETPAERMRRRRESIEFYQHGVDWTNRMIAGDSLVIMNSLLEKEGMAGQIQMVYIDPPYGIKYGSNFQPFVGDTALKSGDKDEDLSQEPEMIKAFRDTWELGIHSYLSYLRNRLLLAKELLSDTGSVFIQISDENLHYVRNICDDIFGVSNFVSQISIKKGSVMFAKKLLNSATFYIVWYAKCKENIKFHPMFNPKEYQDFADTCGSHLWAEDIVSHTSIRPTPEERANIDAFLSAHPGHKLFGTWALNAQGNDKQKGYVFNGKEYFPPRGTQWKTSYPDGLDDLKRKNRLQVEGDTLRVKLYYEDYPISRLNNLWTGIGAVNSKIYVVQTATEIIKRCMLMTTDPGDLVLDITCGSGTTAYVAEQWGRRWITCDTSRVAITLAKQRLMTAIFDYYKLAHEEQGVGSGFIYKTAPHVTIGSIVNNEPPEVEILYDQPEIDKTKVRVAGPFTVEALPAPVVKPLDDVLQNDEDVSAKQTDWRDQLLATGILGRGGARLEFSRVEPLSGTRYLQAEAETKEEAPRRAVICFAGETKPLDSRMVAMALDEAENLRPAPKLIVFAAFQFDPEAAKDIDSTNWPGVTLLKAQMNTDLMTEDLKKKRSSDQSFWLVGQPDVELIHDKRTKDKYKVKVNGFDYYDVKKGTVESGGTSRIAMWMLDTDYDGMCIEPDMVFFPMGGKKDGWNKLAKTLKTEINMDLIDKYAGNESLWFIAQPNTAIAVKIIDDRGIESLKVIRIGDE